MPTKTIWIQGEPDALGGHYSVLSRMARAFTERGWHVCLLTNEDVGKTIRQHSAFDLHEVHLIELPPSQLHGKRWHQLNEAEKADAYIADLRRLKVALEAYHDPAMHPDAIITERWPIAAGICTQVLAGTDRRDNLPMRDTQQHEAKTLIDAIKRMIPLQPDKNNRLPGLLKVAQADTQSVLVASAVRDISGIISHARHRATMTELLKQHCDRVFVLGGSPALSDFGPSFTGNGRFADKNVTYLGRFFHEDKMPALAYSGDAPPILTQVGFSMNNKPELVTEKMAIFKGAINAWAKSESLRQHPLHLLLPHDTTAKQRAELEQLTGGRGDDAGKVQLKQAVKPAEFQALLQQAHMLVTAGGAGTCQEALMQHMPMVILPLSQGSKEQYRRATLFKQHGLAEYVPLHTLLSAMSEQGIDALRSAMERACAQDRAALEARIHENVSMAGMNAMVDTVDDALTHFDKVRQHRNLQQQARGH